jgi:hypothetical protein
MLGTPRASARGERRVLLRGVSSNTTIGSPLVEWTTSGTADRDRCFATEAILSRRALDGRFAVEVNEKRKPVAHGVCGPALRRSAGVCPAVVGPEPGMGLEICALNSPCRSPAITAVR